MKNTLLALILFLALTAGAAPIDQANLKPPLPRNIWIEMAKIIQPGVVGIFVEFKARPQIGGGRYRDPLFDFLEEFLGERFEPPAPDGNMDKNQPIGTGFIISQDGYIITNQHVAEVGDRHQLKVSVSNSEGKFDEYLDAKLIGRDVRGDIALLKITTPKTLKPLMLGDSGRLEVGEFVAAFGNPFGHSNSMTQGIVSAIGREIKEINRFPFIQTDASINPGNSGGPLVDTNGYVIGVNTAIDARAQGIGFAVPINYVKKVLETLKKGETVKRGYLGIGLTTISPSAAARLGAPGTRGVYVTEVRRGSPADSAGVQVGDIVTKFNGKAINYSEELITFVQDTAIGEKAQLTVARSGQGRYQELNLNIVIGEFPDNVDSWGRRQNNREDRRWSHTPESDEREAPPPTDQPTTYQSSEAPFELGFGLTDSSTGARMTYGIPIDSPFGPIVTRVEVNSPAGKAGLQAGDVILEVNGKSVYNVKNAIPEFAAGANNLVVARKGIKIQLSVPGEANP